eukprot:scaffold611_cov166-Chaetoceros_neogracile.AAC.5
MRRFASVVVGGFVSLGLFFDYFLRNVSVVVFKYLHDPNGHAPYSSERNPMLDDYRERRSTLHALSLSTGSPAVESSIRIIDTECDIDIWMIRLRENINVSHFVMWQSQEIVTHAIGGNNIKDTLDLLFTLIRLASLDYHLDSRMSNLHFRLIDFAR